MTTLYITVNKHVIARNYKTGANDPPYEIRKSKSDTEPLRVHEAVFKGTIRLVYDPKEPIEQRQAACWVEIELDE